MWHLMSNNLNYISIHFSAFSNINCTYIFSKSFNTVYKMTLKRILFHGVHKYLLTVSDNLFSPSHFPIAFNWKVLLLPWTLGVKYVAKISPYSEPQSGVMCDLSCSN